MEQSGGVLLPRAGQFGTILDADGDALRADAVAVLDLGSVALLQHHVAVVLNRHRRFERDGRLLAELALGGHSAIWCMPIFSEDEEESRVRFVGFRAGITARTQ